MRWKVTPRLELVLDLDLEFGIYCLFGCIYYKIPLPLVSAGFIIVNDSLQNLCLLQLPYMIE